MTAMTEYQIAEEATRALVEDIRYFLMSCPGMNDVGKVYASGNAGPGEPAWTVEATDEQGRTFNVEVFGPYVEGADDD